MKQKFYLPALICLLTALLSVSVLAADSSSEYCFASSDFSTAETLEGIFLSQVPDKKQGSIYLGSRLLRSGDVIPEDLLDQLRLLAADDTTGEATVVFYPISQGHVAQPASLKIPIGKQKNHPPEVTDSNFETYRGIANSGKLSVSDPEGESLTINLIKEPRRGTVTFTEDGTFTYTPAENKVGKDSFVFTATDPAGNTSKEATVTVQILKPTTKTTYADMNGDSGHFAAVWMQEEGLFCGEQVAGNLCFQPDKTVSRGEFLAMTMHLLQAQGETEAGFTGFADEKDTPTWLQPYLVTALKTGMITGAATDEGMVFRPTTALTRADAAVMLQNALDLPLAEEAPVFAEESNVPAWAQSSFGALTSAGIDISPVLSSEPMTRRDAAMLLYDVSSLLSANETIQLPWQE